MVNTHSHPCTRRHRTAVFWIFLILENPLSDGHRCSAVVVSSTALCSNCRVESATTEGGIVHYSTLVFLSRGC